MPLSAQGRKFHLADREVQVWLVQLEASEGRFDQCYAWLSADEKARAARLRFEEHRRAFILGRGVLRGLLGAFLEMAPDRIEFTYGPRGKPALPDRSHSLRFNTSNSGNLAVYAFLNDCEIGIDVERIRPMSDLEAIAARFFAPAEAAELLALPEPDRTRGFFNCWTRKEAYIKAVGDGLAVALDSFRVTLRPGVPPEMLWLAGSEEAVRGWTLHDFSPGTEFIGAVAYPERPRPVVIHPLSTVDELLDRLQS